MDDLSDDMEYSDAGESEDEAELSGSESGNSSDSADSDHELQVALQKGLIKPGLVGKRPIKREPINDQAGLTQALSEFRKDLPWIERLDMTLDPVPPPKPMLDQLGENADDLSGDQFNNDFKREMKFYRQAQAAVMTGIKKLHKLKVITKRPPDYFAEMVKTDDHMTKVREKLLSKQLSIEKREKIRGMRQQKEFAKKIQKEVEVKKQKEKKDLSEAVKKYRKGKKDALDFITKDSAKSKGGRGGGRGKRGGGGGVRRRGGGGTRGRGAGKGGRGGMQRRGEGGGGRGGGMRGRGGGMRGRGGGRGGMRGRGGGGRGRSH